MPRQFRSSLVLALFAALLAPPAVLAQQTDTDLLKAILCELKELRAAVHQGQVVAPLLEANVREREQTRSLLTSLGEQQGRLEQEIQSKLARQAELYEAQRSQPRSSDKESDEAMKKELEMALQETARTLRELQSTQVLMSSDISRARSRLAELEESFDRIQRQMRGMAASSNTICEVAP